MRPDIVLRQYNLLGHFRCNYQTRAARESELTAGRQQGEHDAEAAMTISMKSTQQRYAEIAAQSETIRLATTNKAHTVWPMM